MKTLITLSLIAATTLACTKAATPTPSAKVTSTSPVTVADTGFIGRWQATYDTCVKIVTTADSITNLTCTASSIGAYIKLGGDTILINGNYKCIMYVAGDTLTTATYPYTSSNKYYRIH